MVEAECFFRKQKESSRIKAEIVSKYFMAWSNIIASQGNERIGYLDLFSGPGMYEDGSPSTPKLILDNAINHFNKKVQEKIVITFNDTDISNVKKLKALLKTYPKIEDLKHKPKVYDLEVDEEVVKDFDNMNQIPKLSFVDPWGYKGLSLKLIKALVKDWGCDSIFFFNYKRINPGIENERLKDPISILFTKNVLEKLKKRVKNKTPNEREKIIVEEIKLTFKNWGMEYVQPFPFKSKTGRRTEYYLIFVSKNPLGYSIMKEIMGKCSSCHIQDVPILEYNPAKALARQMALFQVEKPLDDLKEMLLKDFSGKKLMREQIYNLHHIDKNYVEKNYRIALLQLEKENKIKTNRKTRKARTGTFPQDMMVYFE